MNRSIRATLVAGATFVGLLLGAAAQAHSPYMLPSAFDVSDRKLVTCRGHSPKPSSAPRW
jgi:hypothetical protein